MAETERQQQVWHLRHGRGWPLDRIGQKLGISKSAVSQLLARAAEQKGISPGPRRFGPKRRIIRPISLSLVHNA